ncbi:MAG: carboxypeptidase-like regulatory domain-containing protein [Deltaproteobacteria bacterium]|nr:carboxypeptidase-like regulatory domain-containing protein [Deltaproteobacteria bacterium]
MRILRMLLVAASLSTTAACLVTASGGTASRPSPPPGQPAGSVSGVVTDARTHAPISQASVDLVLPDHTQVSRVSTDASGRFSTPSAAPGPYLLRVGRNGYAGSVQGIELHNGPSEINVALTPTR